MFIAKKVSRRFCLHSQALKTGLLGGGSKVLTMISMVCNRLGGCIIMDPLSDHIRVYL